MAFFITIAPRPVKAETDMPSITGVVSTLYSYYMAFIGTTKVTPMAVLSQWVHDDYGVYRNIPFARYKRCSADLILMNYFFTEMTLNPNGTYSTSYEAFPLNFVARRNYRCDLSSGGFANVYNVVSDFEMAVRAASVVKTGYFPPGAPYPARIKSWATPLASTCNPPTSTARTVRNSVNINDTGWSRVRFGLVGYDYSWPPLVWVGDIYDY